jgi:hypothetical protein
MIIWTGNGIYALIIMMSSVAFPLVGALEFAAAYPKLDSMPYIFTAVVFGLILGGIICFKLGRRWNKNVDFGQYHTLYFVRVEHWGVICLVLGTLLMLVPLVAAGINYLFLKHHH